MADDNAGERGSGEERFQPFDSREIEMICRLIQQQNVRILHQGLGNREAFAPSSRECNRFGGEIFKTRSSERVAEATFPFALGNAAPLQRCKDDIAHRIACLELRFLRDVAETGALAHGNFAGVGIVSPARMRSSVDLPEPFGPIRPMRSPSLTVNEIPRKSVVAPKDLARLWALRIGEVGGIFQELNRLGFGGNGISMKAKLPGVASSTVEAISLQMFSHKLPQI